MKKKEWEKLIGHIIRQDTYQFLERMNQGEDYDEIYQDLDSHREAYGLKNYSLTKKETIEDILVKYQGDKNDEKTDLDLGGIYCIEVDGDIVYIGKTKVSFKQRFEQHKSQLTRQQSQYKLYSFLSWAKENGQKVTLKGLIPRIGSKFHKGRLLTDEELCCMEFALINCLKPICNTVYI